jgi:hypothetical protein
MGSKDSPAEAELLETNESFNAPLSHQQTRFSFLFSFWNMFIRRLMRIRKMLL